MPTNLVASITNVLSSELVSRIASGLGLDRAAVEKAVTASIPALLAALTSLVAKPEGPAKLSDAVAQQQPGILTNIANVIGGAGQKEMIDNGLGTLSSLLGRSILSSLTNAVSRYAGLGEFGSKSLVGLLGPLLLGVLGQQQRANGLDVSGLAQLITSQKDNIARALPSGFANYLSGTGILERIGEPSFGHRRPEPSHSSQWGWVLPALAVAAIGALGLYLLSHTPTDTAGTLPQASVESPQAYGGAPFIVTEDETRDWIGRSVYSSDNKKIGEILELKRDPANKVTDVYVDIGTFLGMGGTRYHITSDQIREVKPDGLVLTVNESEVKGHN
jgi:Bacterial protein of unknown function (DUF937)/PRC-barrel domain